MPRLTTQSDVTNPQRKGYDFRIDDFLLRAATGPSQDRQMIIQSSDVGQENAVNVKQNAEDFTTNIGRVFSRNDFSGGSNLDKAHKADTTAKDIKRFWDSENIDVFNSDLGNAYNSLYKDYLSQLQDSDMTAEEKKKQASKLANLGIVVFPLSSL